MVPHGCWEPKPVPLQKDSVLVTAERPLQSLVLIGQLLKQQTLSALSTRRACDAYAFLTPGYFQTNCKKNFCFPPPLWPGFHTSFHSLINSLIYLCLSSLQNWVLVSLCVLHAKLWHTLKLLCVTDVLPQLRVITKSCCKNYHLKGCNSSKNSRWTLFICYQSYISLFFFLPRTQLYLFCLNSYFYRKKK